MENKYLSEFQILGSSIKLVKIKNDFITLGNEEKLKRNIDVAHSVETISSSNDGKKLLGTLLLKIKVTVSSTGKKKYVLNIELEGGFSAPNDMGIERFKEMLEINGVTSLYSIARGFVQSISSQTLASGSVLLPLFNVVAYSKDLNKKQSSS